MYITQNPYSQSLYNRNSCSNRKIPFTSAAGRELQAACCLPLKVLELGPDAQRHNVYKTFLTILNTKNEESVNALWNRTRNTMPINETLKYLIGKNPTPDKISRTLKKLIDTFKIAKVLPSINNLPPDRIGRTLISDALLEIENQLEIFSGSRKGQVSIESYCNSNTEPKISLDPEDTQIFSDIKDSIYNLRADFIFYRLTDSNIYGNQIVPLVGELKKYNIPPKYVLSDTITT